MHVVPLTPIDAVHIAMWTLFTMVFFLLKFYVSMVV